MYVHTFEKYYKNSHIRPCITLYGKNILFSNTRLWSLITSVILTWAKNVIHDRNQRKTWKLSIFLLFLFRMLTSKNGEILFFYLLWLNLWKKLVCSNTQSNVVQLYFSRRLQKTTRFWKILLVEWELWSWCDIKKVTIFTRLSFVPMWESESSLLLWFNLG